ncbi:hypothetical protein [Nonomuraea candida]|uniref:hypothetical protein n=1 Tax=Nonomuraea candida TaxID=359159 RepID=UPI0012F856C2|nr:hypothetical protein [Nonomuraea candida]
MSTPRTLGIAPSGTKGAAVAQPPQRRVEIADVLQVGPGQRLALGERVRWP